MGTRVRGSQSACMPITVAQLAADAQLGLTVLSGHVGLRHEINWAHTSELLDPTQWLEEGELFLTPTLTGLRYSSRL